MSLVREVFRALRVLGNATGETQTYAVVPAPTRTDLLLGRDGRGRPALLVRCRTSDQGRPAPVRTNGIEVSHDVACVVTLPGAASEAMRLSLVRCASDDRTLQDYFIDLLETVVVLVPPDPTRTQVAGVVLKLCELFAALEEPARRDERAVWAELFVIATAADPAVAAGGWRTDPTEAFDFSWGRRRLEVKSYAREPRGHHFGLAQVRPPDGLDVIIVSMLVRSASGGATVRDLLTRIRASVGSPELVLKVEQVVAKSLGAATAPGMAAAFDEQAAQESWRCFVAAEVPAVRIPVPPAVTDVRFRVAMEDVPYLTRRQAGLVYAAFAPALPRVWA